MLCKCKYWSKDISLNLLDINRAIDFKNFKTYLEVQGPPYHQNIENPNKKEFHYFCCDSAIFITEYSEKADIKIISPRFASSEKMKSKIENILSRAI